LFIFSAAQQINKKTPKNVPKQIERQTSNRWSDQNTNSAANPAEKFSIRQKMEISEGNSPQPAKRISRRGWIIGITTCCVAIGIGVGVGVGVGGGDSQVDEPIRIGTNFGLGKLAMIFYI
jgi:hypothetical protein